MGGTSKKGDGKKSDITALSKGYLLLYNGVQTVGWSYVFFQSIRYLLKNQSVIGLWDNYGAGLLAFQSLAVLEVVHCVIGIVKANPVLTAFQVASRVYQAWAILFSVPEIQNLPSVASLILAWGLTEVVRYSFYVTNLTGLSVKFLTWCRYSFFYALYPVGALSEIVNIVMALDTMKRKQLYSVALPNIFNISFSFYYFNLFLLLSYLPLFPQLFNHMRYQRKKVLGTGMKVAENGAKKIH